VERARPPVPAGPPKGGATALLPEQSGEHRQAYADLAGRIAGLRLASGRRSVVVTSAETGEGKSLCAAGLAGAFAERTDGRVLLLECDFRAPSMAGLLDVDPSVSVDEVVEGRGALDGAVVPVADASELFVAAARGPRQEASRLCLSPGMSGLLQAAHGAYSMTVIDAPAALVYPDACRVARECGGTVVVARTAGPAAVRDSVAKLKASGAEVLGVVALGDAASRLYGDVEGSAGGSGHA
jgi:Mrp family chromosome partitioning ATPase